MNLNSLFAREKHKPSGKEIPRQKPAFTYRAVTLVSGCLLSACSGDLSSHPSLSRAQQEVSTPRTSGVECGEERDTTGDLEVEAEEEGSTLQFAVLEVRGLFPTMGSNGCQAEHLACCQHRGDTFGRGWGH